MIGRSPIAFAELRRILLDLGFAESRREKFWLFEHAPSQTNLAYRPYQAREKVTLVDLHITRQDLDWHGLMAPEAFDNLLARATA